MKLLISIAFAFLSLILLGVALFYRFHDCFWIREYSEREPTAPGWTEAQLRGAGMLKTCPTPIVSPPVVRNLPQSMPFMPVTTYSPTHATQPTPTVQLSASASAELRKNYMLRLSCEAYNNKIIQEYQGTNRPVDVKDWYSPATKAEYTACIKDYGAEFIGLIRLIIFRQR